MAHETDLTAIPMYYHQRATLRVNSRPNKEEELHFGLVSYFHKTKLWLPPAGASSETDSFLLVNTHIVHQVPLDL